MSRENILIIEDDEDIQELVQYNLAREGYRPTGVLSGEEGLKAVRSGEPDLILLDLMLPGMDGLEMCRILKADRNTKHIPIVMLTAKGEEADIVTGLEVGADDYITKPFSPGVLIARIKAVLRRASTAEINEDDVLKHGDLVIDPGRHRVMADGRKVDLTRTEFRLLHLLARRRGWVFTRYQIVDAIKGEDYPVTDRSVDVQVAGLRKKLGSCGRHIETVHGVGYRFGEES